MDDINLWNFEEDRFSNSHHVLTSPRSLKACDSLGFQPCELLYKPLSEFHEKGQQTGVPFQATYDLYEHKEKERLEKLHACREKRLKLIQDALHFEVDLHKEGGAHRQSRLPASVNDMQKSSVEFSCTPESLQRRRTYETLSDHNLLPTSQKYNHLGGGDNLAHVSVSDQQAKESPRTFRKTSPKGQNKISPRATQHLRRTSPKVSPRRVSPRVSEYKPAWLPVKEKDHKILKALIKKREEEIEADFNSRKALLDWEEEKIQRKDKELNEEHKRKHLLAEKIRYSQHMRELDKELRKDQEEMRVVERETSCLLSDAKWARLASERKYMQAQMHDLKRQRDVRKKRNQENSLRQKERKLDQQRLETWYKQQQNLLRASLKKEGVIAREKMIRGKLNERDRKLNRRNLKEISQQEKERQESLETGVILKHLHAERNYLERIQNQETQLYQQAKEREEKIETCRDRQVKKEAYLDQWRKDVQICREMSARKARLSASRAAQEKALKARTERAEKEAQQRQKYHSVLQEEKAKTMDTKITIALKELKMEEIKDQKEQSAHEMRVLAASSQSLRDLMKKQYGGDTFDKKAFKVELEQKVGAGQRSATKNESKVILG